ncbi:hypothetical protein STEG23_031482, partial [Scotinomys teguina]
RVAKVTSRAQAYHTDWDYEETAQACHDVAVKSLPDVGTCTLHFSAPRIDPLFQSSGLLTVTIVCDQRQGMTPHTLFSSWVT